MEFKHQPVLLQEVLEYLPFKNGGIFVDGTLGGGGHTRALLEKLQVASNKLQVIGIDQDLEAIFAAKKNLKEFSDQVEFVHDNYLNLAEILKSKGIEKVDGILLDLGVSSYQLDNKDRGFSFLTDASLDMRMNQSDTESAADIINNYSEEDLAGIFYDWGEERNSRKIAKNIAEARKTEKIETTNQLSKIVEQSFPASYKNKYKIHPATRVFQALRIETNNELNILKEFIPQAAELLADGGRLLIISFHSLEDGIAKHAFRELEQKFPKKFKVLTKKPLTATENEIRENLRSRSAKLRVLEKLN
ncbi:MAG: 16S rRNA (cytosine(1402)-N(4))-methyltransferase RsmH [Candidatus Berkelbacteria bacterium]